MTIYVCCIAANSTNEHEQSKWIWATKEKGKNHDFSIAHRRDRRTLGMENRINISLRTGENNIQSRKIFFIMLTIIPWPDNHLIKYNSLES